MCGCVALGPARGRQAVEHVVTRVRLVSREILCIDCFVVADATCGHVLATEVVARRHRHSGDGLECSAPRWERLSFHRPRTSSLFSSYVCEDYATFSLNFSGTQQWSPIELLRLYSRESVINTNIACHRFQCPVKEAAGPTSSMNDLIARLSCAFGVYRLSTPLTRTSRIVVG